MEATTVPDGSVGVPGWQAPQNLKDACIHMVGIGGSGMCGLAGVLMRRGARVSGSDREQSRSVLNLRERGAAIGKSESPHNLPEKLDVLVASAAVRDEHPELIEARRRGVPVIKYAQLLGALMARHRGVAVSGTHGKSTTTAWLAFLLRQAGLDPSFVIGAEVAQLGGGSGVGDGPLFLAEACEYDRSFLSLAPRAAVILNIEEDHLDYYADIDAITDAFADFARLLPDDGLLLLNADAPRCRDIARIARRRAETFGFAEAATWRAAELELSDGRYQFTLMHNARPIARVALGLAGQHNVMNALAVAGLAHWCGAGVEQIQRGLAEFQGAKRRLECRGEAGGVLVADDYAHHPTEIRVTLKAAQERFRPRRLWCIFQPHQHSRTRFLLADFAASFASADFVVVPDIYFVRDSARERELISGADLAGRIAAHGRAAVHIPEFSEIIAHVAARAEPGDLVLTMGAGDIWKVADELLCRLRADLPG